MPKVTNISFDKAEEIESLKDNEVLISIGEEYGDFWKLKVKGDKVLKLKFSDVRAVAFIKEKFLNPISLEQCHQIIDFVEKYDGYDVIVNCAAGVNRSASIALFLNLIYKYELKPNFYKLSEGNPYVLGVLISEYLKRENGVYNDDWTVKF